MKKTLLALAATLLGAPAAAQAPQTAASAPASVDYASEANWLCLPGRDDPCGRPLATAALDPHGFGSPGIPLSDAYAISHTDLHHDTTTDAHSDVDRNSNTLANQPPVIDRVEYEEDRSSGYLIILMKIYFQDVDGDAISVHYELIEGSPERDWQASDRRFSPSPAQKEGTFITARTHCGSSEVQVVDATATFEATISDQAGHQSNPILLNIHCH